VISASSFHPGGVNAVLGDGAVRFFSETISSTGGNGTIFPVTNGPATEAEAASWVQTSGKSWHGVWGALGSRNGGENATPP
ncbi:MAG: DUF1559 domain-containing protein, partial [Planctomycetaceae bacterium]|nr:DUF1559 domain-containing protein [Planctomycetaceae bacterium]